MVKVSITLLFDSDKSVKLEGDRDLVAKIIACVDDTLIGYIKHEVEPDDKVGHWDMVALQKILDRESGEDETIS